MKNLKVWINHTPHMTSNNHVNFNLYAIYTSFSKATNLPLFYLPTAKVGEFVLYIFLLVTLSCQSQLTIDKCLQRHLFYFSMSSIFS